MWRFEAWGKSSKSLTQTAVNYKGTKAAAADVKGNLKGYKTMLI